MNSVIEFTNGRRNCDSHRRAVISHCRVATDHCRMSGDRCRERDDYTFGLRLELLMVFAQIFSQHHLRFIKEGFMLPPVKRMAE